VIGGLIVSEIFQIRLAPLLATSAIFSIVLGLALQDTLGNLFAAIALQLDKPYEIGDWIEVQSGTQKWIGQVYEISWRATVLIGLSDESLTIPNRVMAQAEVSNFSHKARPLVRSQSFRIPFGTPIPLVKETLARAGAGVPAIRKNPAPFALVSETTESWITVKLVYFIDDYGSQWAIADQVLTHATRALAEARIELAGPRLQVHRQAEA
jgi:small-conductance mechanosensitive channel